MAHGADPNRASFRGETPFDAAGGYASIPVLELLLQYGPNIKSGGELQHAVRDRKYISGRIEVIEFLLGRDADIDKIETHLLPDRHQWWGTPLHVAAAEGDEEFVKLLLARAADTSIRNTRGWTAVREAKEHNYKSIVALLDADNKGKRFSSQL